MPTHTNIDRNTRPLTTTGLVTAIGVFTTACLGVVVPVSYLPVTLVAGVVPGVATGLYFVRRAMQDKKAARR